MNRRSFLKESAIGIAALAAANLLEHQAEMARRALGRRPSKGIRRRTPYGRRDTSAARSS
ncbi:MAG: twin-arginine translocation signal domain-containing protein [Bacteroidales bacterium]|nr:twin-arginine translocation signal domain-containing protein [Bacteroidales bacterium]